MDRIPLRSGDFVWTLFPYDTEPDSPGPIRHAACVIAACMTFGIRSEVF